MTHTAALSQSQTESFKKTKAILNMQLGFKRRVLRLECAVFFTVILIYNIKISGIFEAPSYIGCVGRDMK